MDLTEIENLTEVGLLKRYRKLVTAIKLHPTIYNYQVLKKAGVTTNYLSASVYEKSSNSNIHDDLIRAFNELKKIEDKKKC